MTTETLRLTMAQVPVVDPLDGAGIDGAQLGAAIGLAVLVLAALGAVLLIGAALVQISQAVHLREPARARWVLSVVFAPVFGAIAWFAVGNRPQTD